MVGVQRHDAPHNSGDQERGEHRQQRGLERGDSNQHGGRAEGGDQHGSDHPWYEIAHAIGRADEIVERDAATGKAARGGSPCGEPGPQPKAQRGHGRECSVVGEQALGIT